MDISIIVDMTNNHPRPAQICRELLNALEASDGRRKRRKRDTTPDAIGLEVKRDLLVRAVAADPGGLVCGVCRARGRLPPSRVGGAETPLTGGLATARREARGSARRRPPRHRR